MTPPPFLTELRVPFRDVDAWGMVWHGHYFSYVDAARAEIMRGIGLTHQLLSECDLLMPIIHVEMDYQAALSIDAPMQIQTRFHMPSRARFHTLFEIWDLSNPQAPKRATQGMSEQTFITQTTRKLTRHIPPALQSLLNKLCQGPQNPPDAPEAQAK